jgi:hypothetical protein
MASCSIWPAAASAMSRSSAIRGEPHRSRRSRSTRSTKRLPRTTLRRAAGSPAHPAGPALEAADVELGLRYLTDFAVVVLAESADPQTVAVVADAARWGEARMILVLDAGQTVPAGLPSEVIVFESPQSDPDGAFADLVGTFAASIDEGTEPAEAFRSSIASDGWTEAGSA